MKNLKEINSEISNTLNSFIDSPINEKTLDSIKNNIETTIETYYNGTTKNIKTVSLWKEMTLKEKFLWFFCNKIFPEIGRFARYYFLYRKDYDYIKLQPYFESNPKSTINCYCDITLPIPAEYINLKIQL